MYKNRTRFLQLVVALVSGLLQCCGRANLESEKLTPSSRVDMKTESKENEQCIGRFRFALPSTMSVSGRSQSIYHVDVSTVPIPPGGAQSLWNARVTQLRALTPQATNGSSVRTFELEPGVPALWSAKNPDSPQRLNLEVMKVSGNHVLLASRSLDVGEETKMETLVKIVVDAYLPNVNSGFCVGFGSITSEPGLNEQTRIALAHKQLSDLEITLQTQTVARPDLRTYSDVNEEKDFMAAKGGKLSVLRNHSRSVAALEGKEIWIVAEGPGEPPLVRFTWHFAGVPQNSSKPMINVVGTAPVKNQLDLEKIWDDLLNSIQTVPPSPQRSQ
jgi:Tle cognate immunity protein 4 C-terminal domain